MIRTPVEISRNGIDRGKTARLASRTRVDGE